MADETYKDRTFLKDLRYGTPEEDEAEAERAIANFDRLYEARQEGIKAGLRYGTLTQPQAGYDLFTLLAIAGFSFFAGVISMLLTMPRCGS